jgi:hypothetical protein
MKRGAIFLSFTLAAVASLLVACGEGAKRSKGDVNGYCASGQVNCSYPGGYPGYPGQGGYGYGKAWTGSLNVTNYNVYQDLIKNSGLCNQFWLINIGSADCDSWDSQAAVYLEVYGTTLPAQGQITLMPYLKWGGSGTIPPFKGQLMLTNNNTGFELRTNGTNAAYKKVIRTVGNVGNIVVNGQYVQQIRLTFYYGDPAGPAQFGYADVFLRW